jgi:hypothetical protein
VSLILNPSSPGDRPHHPLTETALEGPFGGPTYSYRSAVIDCLKGGHVCRLTLDGHPLTGTTFGVAGTITPLVDLWLEEGRLPSYMRPMPKVSLQLSCREDLERRSRSP